MDDREKRGVDDRLNDIYSTYRTGRFIAGLGRAFSAARGAIAAAGVIGSGGWVASVIGIALIVVLVPTFLIVLGGGGAASEIPIEEQAPQEISGVFNIVGATDDKIKEIERIFSAALSYPFYKNLLTRDGQITIRLVDNLTFRGKVIDGRVDSKDEILIRSNLISQKLKYTLLHETGHIIALRNGRIYRSFDHSNFVREDAFCYINRYLKTYPVEGAGGGGGEHSESFAEAIALFLIPKEIAPLNDFQNQCKETYGWIRDNVFNEN